MKTGGLLVVLFGAIVGAQTSSRAQVDHLVVAVRSLSEGIDEFQRLTGVKPVAGGKHPDRGTQNALVSLGGGRYFEILAPQEGATLSPLDEGIRGLDRLRIIGWAVTITDVDAAVAALKAQNVAATPPQAGSRVTPAGETLAWTTFGFADRSFAMAPFFINWGAGSKHPSTTSPGGCTLLELIVTDPAGDRLGAALKATGVADVTFAHGAPRIEARLRCGSRTATFTTP